VTTVQLSDVGIGNMALNLIGSSQTVSTLTGAPKSNEMAQLQFWYYFCRDAELTDWPYPFATVYAQLNQVGGPTPTYALPANPEYLYSYRTPSDCLAIRRLVLGNLVLPPPIVPPMTGVPSQVGQGSLAFARQGGDPVPQPYEESVDSVGKLILTDVPNAWIRYTFQQQNAAVFNYPFAQLLAHRTAIMLYPLTRDEKRRQTNERMYEHWKTVARAKQMNDTQNDQVLVDYNSEFVRGRYNG
jgi:hypothetical protein